MIFLEPSLLHRCQDRFRGEDKPLRWMLLLLDRRHMRMANIINSEIAMQMSPGWLVCNRGVPWPGQQGVKHL